MLMKNNIKAQNPVHHSCFSQYAWIHTAVNHTSNQNKITFLIISATIFNWLRNKYTLLELFYLLSGVISSHSCSVAAVPSEARDTLQYYLRLVPSIHLQIFLFIYVCSAEYSVYIEYIRCKIRV